MGGGGVGAYSRLGAYSNEREGKSIIEYLKGR